MKYNYVLGNECVVDEEPCIFLKLLFICKLRYHLSFVRIWHFLPSIYDIFVNKFQNLKIVFLWPENMQCKYLGVRMGLLHNFYSLYKVYGADPLYILEIPHETGLAHELTVDSSFIFLR